MDLFEAILWLALNIYHEARSEPLLGQKAVAHVTINRAYYKSKSIKEVVTAPYQFSWTFQKKSYIPNDWEAFKKCMQAAQMAMREKDFTQGADHYHLETVNPEWKNDMTYIGKYGSHLFYRDYDLKRIKAKKKKRKIK